MKLYKIVGTIDGKMRELDQEFSPGPIFSFVSLDDLNDTLQQIVEQAQIEGFHAFNLEGGYLTFWREKDRQTMEVWLGQLRGFNRPLTDEEVHLLAT